MGKKNYLNDILAKQAYIEQNMTQKDPFDKGIMRAVKSAKQSLEMDEDQDDRAMRNAITTFGEQIGQMPRVKGFMANFAQAGRALAPALRTHDQYEDAAKNENRQAIAYAQALRAAEEAKAAQLEQQAYAREMADEQRAFQRERLAEQRDYHQLKLEREAAKDNFANKGEFHQIKGKQEYNRIGKKYGVAADLYDEVKGIKAEYNEMLETLKEAGVPANPITLNKYVTQGRGFFSSFGNQDTLQRKLAVKHAQLNSRIERLAMQYEQADKGRGLTDFTVRYANDKKLFPKMEDNPDVFLGKLNNLYHDSELSYKALDASLKDGVYITKDNYNNYLNYRNNGANATQTENVNKQNVTQKSVFMRDPETGEEDSIPIERIQEALDDGLILVE